MTKTEAIIAFLTLFFIQFAFNFNDIVQGLSLESDMLLTCLLIAKQAMASLIATLIFYGYNRLTKPKEG